MGPMKLDNQVVITFYFINHAEFVDLRIIMFLLGYDYFGYYKTIKGVLDNIVTLRIVL